MYNYHGDKMKKIDLLWIGLLLLLDQVSKILIDSKMDLHQSIEVIKNFFYITYTRNTGAAFSILEGKMIFFYIVSVVALAAMLYYFRKVDQKNLILRLAFVFLIAGTAGNFIDRLMFQYVRDFLHFIIFSYDFAIFNVADATLSIGVVFLLLDAVLEERKKVQ